MIKAVIFDFDGIIVDSEPLWVEVEHEIFASVGIRLTPDMCKQTTGLNTQDTIRYWHNLYPWTEKTQFQLYKEIIERMQAMMLDRVEVMEGFLDVLQFFVERKIPLGIASASPLKLITTALKRFHLFEYFKTISSGENEEFGKPHPVIYLSASAKIGVPPNHCLAFEDSFNGCIAAKAARMKLVAVPDAHDRHAPRFEIADLKLESLSDFNPGHFETLNSLP